MIFTCVNTTLNKTLEEKAPKTYRKEKRKLGFICFLYTFGRDMKWHPHIHFLYTEKFIRDIGTLGDCYYLAFEAIRKRFLYTFINSLSKELKIIDQKNI